MLPDIFLLSFSLVVGFYMAFMPLYVLGMMGFMRRTQHYNDLAFHPYMIFAFCGPAFAIIYFLACPVPLGTAHRDTSFER